MGEVTIINIGTCNIFWGSHGCYKQDGHEASGDIIHRCGDEDDPCSEFIVLGPADPVNFSVNGAVRYFVLYPDGTEGWDDEWLPSHWFA